MPEQTPSRIVIALRIFRATAAELLFPAASKPVPRGRFGACPFPLRPFRQGLRRKLLLTKRTSIICDFSIKSPSCQVPGQKMMCSAVAEHDVRFRA